MFPPDLNLYLFHGCFVLKMVLLGLVGWLSGLKALASDHWSDFELQQIRDGRREPTPARFSDLPPPNKYNKELRNLHWV